MAETLNKQQRADVERLAWEWRRKGRTVRTIAEKIALPVEQGGLGIQVHYSTVDRALQRLEKRMYAELTGKIEEVKAQQINQLQTIQEIAMEEYDRSRENADLTRTLTKAIGTKPRKDGGIPEPEERPGMYLSQSENGDYEETSEEEREALLRPSQPGLLTVVEQTTTSESRGQTGDPRYLDVARSAMADVRKILGLDAQKDGATLEVVVKAYTGVDTDKI